MRRMRQPPLRGKCATASLTIDSTMMGARLVVTRWCVMARLVPTRRRHVAVRIAMLAGRTMPSVPVLHLVMLNPLKL